MTLTPDAILKIDREGGATKAEICAAAATITLAAFLAAALALNASDSKLNESWRFGMGRLSTSAAAARVDADVEMS